MCKDPRIIERFGLYFGTAADKLFPAFYQSLTLDSRQLLQKEPFCQLPSRLATPDLNALFFLKQEHTALGHAITSLPKAEMSPFVTVGDYIMTDQIGVGLGVMTGDCLPIILLDVRQGVCAVVHAGWRGLFGGILVDAIKKMRSIYKTDPEELHLIFGPAIKACCYRVDAAFVAMMLNKYPYAECAITQRDNEYFFDLPRFAVLQLFDAGYSEISFCEQQYPCTHCDDSFFSYRRQGDVAGRQMTVVVRKA